MASAPKPRSPYKKRAAWVALPHVRDSGGGSGGDSHFREARVRSGEAAGKETVPGAVGKVTVPGAGKVTGSAPRGGDSGAWGA